MKKLTALYTCLLFFTATLCLLGSCKKDDAGNFYMTAEVNGQAWKADQDFSNAQINYSESDGQRDTYIWAQSSLVLENGKHYNISMSFPGKPTIGTHTDVRFVGQEFNGAGDLIIFRNADNGTILITKATKEFLEGTFSGGGILEGGGTITLTNGKFKARVSGSRDWNP